MRSRRSIWLLAGLVGLCACRPPAPAPGPSPATRPAPAPPPATGRPPGTPEGRTPAPQFTFSTWRRAIPLIKQGRVVQTVSGHGGFSLILDDHTWVRLVAEPGDPLPGNPKAYIAQNAPNAKAIKHSTE